MEADALDEAFFADFEAMSAAADSGGEVTPEIEAGIKRTQAVLAALFAEVSAAVEPQLGPRAMSPMPTPHAVKQYVTKGGKRLDYYVRFFAGGWNKDVKLVVDVMPNGVQIYLTSWMASAKQSAAFTRFLDLDGLDEEWVRDHVRELSADLERRYGVALHLQQSVRIGSHAAAARGWPNDDDDWELWRTSAAQQAGIGLWFHPFNPEVVIEWARADAYYDPLQAAGRVIGGREGRALPDAHDVPLETAVSRAADDREETFWKLVDDGMLNLLVADTAAGLSKVLQTFWVTDSRRRVRPSRQVAHTASVAEIADATWGGLLDREPSAEAHVIKGRRLEKVVEPDGRSATIGWGTDAAPRILIDRPAGETVRIAFESSVLLGRYADPLRPKLAKPLRGPEGWALTDLLRASGGTAAAVCGRPECRKRGQCPLNSDFVNHWLMGGPEPVLRWTFLTDGGDRDWLSVPSQVVGDLLLQALPHPPELVVPEAEFKGWDVFVSTPGKPLGFVGSRIATALRLEGLNPWYMADHQYYGSDIDDNTREGIRHSRAVLVVLHDTYWKSPFCVAEFLEAVKRKKEIVPIAVTPDGDPAAVGDQLRAAKAGIAMVSDDTPKGDVTAAVEKAKDLLGTTIRASIREGDKGLSREAIGAVAPTLRRHR